jgi:hypothetical protein
VDLACNLVRIPDCDFIVELLADSNLDKTIVICRNADFASNLSGSADLYTPIPPPPLPIRPRIAKESQRNFYDFFTFPRF